MFATTTDLSRLLLEKCVLLFYNFSFRSNIGILCFTKCVRPMVNYWRDNGVDIVLYLDDGLGMGRNLGDAINYSSFFINMEKSSFVPVQSLEWLGLLWDSVKFTLRIPKRRIDNAINSINMIISNFPVFTARSLARATGKILSMSPVMGNITSLRTRYLNKESEGRIRWDLNLVRIS